MGNGSIIDTNDQSGYEFLNNFMENTPGIFKYMINATGGQLYDFKRTNGIEGYNGKLDPYRGMPIGTFLYTSARDIGNIAAGYIAGLYNISWKSTRFAFDTLQSRQDGKPSTEGISSQNAQYLGWKIGQHNFAFTYRFLPSLVRIITTPTDIIHFLNKLRNL